MPSFSLESKIPSCLVNKKLISTIEDYLNVEMRQKLGTAISDEISYAISIKEKIGTETLASISDFTPNTFPNGTKEIKINWKNGYKANCELNVVINFESDNLTGRPRLNIDCTASTARETAVGIKDSILRIFEAQKNLNWIFNPFGPNLWATFFGILLLFFPFLAFVSTLNREEQGWYVLSGAAFLGWYFFSGLYFRPYVSFDTRRQQIRVKIWRWFSLGTLGAILFGTVIPFLLRMFILRF